MKQSPSPECKDRKHFMKSDKHKLGGRGIKYLESKVCSKDKQIKSSRVLSAYGFLKKENKRKKKKRTSMSFIIAVISAILHFQVLSPKQSSVMCPHLIYYKRRNGKRGMRTQIMGLPGKSSHKSPCLI